MGNCSHGKFRSLFPKERQLQQTESRYPTLINYKVHAGSFHVSVIHRTLTWTTGYFKMCTWSFLCVRIHTEVGHTDNESAPHFWLDKFFLCSWRGSDLRSLDLEFNALSTELPRHHRIKSKTKGWRDGSVGRASDLRSKDRRFDPSASGAQEKIVRVFLSQKCCADSLLVCPTQLPCVHARIRMNHVHTAKIL